MDPTNEGARRSAGALALAQLDKHLELWGPTRHYSRLTKEGRNRPPPSIGSPTLIWHLGIWRKQGLYESFVEGRAEQMSHTDSPKAQGWGPNAARTGAQDRDDSSQDFAHRAGLFDVDNETFIEEVNAILLRLQSRGRVDDAEYDHFRREFLDIEGVTERDRKPEETFKTPIEPTITFTIWWGAASAERRRPRIDEIDDSYLRVVVQAQTFFDHATLSFYLDADSTYSGRPIVTSTRMHEIGGRRSTIATHLQSIRTVAKEQILTLAVDLDPIEQEKTVSSQGEDLQKAADFFYSEIWSEFQDDFGFNLSKAPKSGSDGPRTEPSNDITFETGAIFQNLRGLSMSTRGIETQSDETRRMATRDLARRNEVREDPFPEQDSGSAPDLAQPEPRWAAAAFGPVDRFDLDVSEPEVVLKAHVPFLRRVVPGADRRSWIGCGLLHGRALLATPLGSSTAGYIHDDRVSRGVFAAEIEDLSHAPVRFLILTKNEPHREQIGRIIERFLALETARLVSLRTINLIRNASYYLRIVTDTLNDALNVWSKTRERLRRCAPVGSRIQSQEEAREATDREQSYLEWLLSPSPSPAGSPELIKDTEAYYDLVRKVRLLRSRSNRSSTNAERKMAAEDAYFEVLTHLNEYTEDRLITVAADFERLSFGGSGRLSFNIRRAQYYSDELMRLAPSLEIVNIDGWITYTQFVDRGMRPLTSMIESTGKRLVSARERLTSLTEVIQTSALIAQSHATRRNTEEIRRISRRFEVSYIGKAAAGATVIAIVTSRIFEALIDWLAAGFDVVWRFLAPTLSALIAIAF